MAEETKGNGGKSGRGNDGKAAEERAAERKGGKTDVSPPAEHCCLVQRVPLPRGDKKESAVYLLVAAGTTAAVVARNVVHRG